MKSWNKTLCLLLAAVLCLGAAAPGAFGEFSDAGSIQNREAVDLLTAIGVINGFPEDNSFRPGETLTRAQGATIVAKLLGYSVATLPNTCGFIDVPAWARPAVGLCERQGIVAGIGNSRFDPDGKLTGAAFAKMLLCALGYSAETEGLTGSSWAANTARLAGETALNGSVSAANTNITRDDACQMAFQALTVPKVAYSGAIKGAAGSFLADSFGLGVRGGAGLSRREFSADSRIEGVVTLNSANSSDAASHKSTMVGGLMYSIDSGMELLGHKVVLYKQAAGSCVCITDRSDRVIVLSSDAMGRDAVIQALGNVSLDADFRAIGDIAVTSDGAAARNVVSAPAGTYILTGTRVVGAIAAAYVGSRADRVTGVYYSGVTLQGAGTLTAGNYNAYAGIRNGDVVLVEEVNGVRTITKARTVSGTLSRITRHTLLTMGETRYAPSEIPDDANLPGDLLTGGSLSRELDFATAYTLYLDANGNYFAITAG